MFASATMSTARRRLEQIQHLLNGTESSWQQLVVLPDGTPVNISPSLDGGERTTISVGGNAALAFQAVDHDATVMLSVVEKQDVHSNYDRYLHIHFHSTQN